MSYSQIKKIIGVSKSTLSSWLRNYPFSKERIAELQDHNQRRIERFRKTMRKKRRKRLAKIYKSQKKYLLPFNDREFFIAGLLLYWGEGTKSRKCGLAITNTDPAVSKFFIAWLEKSLFVPRHKIKIELHLYNDMNIKEEIQYWSKILKIPLKQFNRPYVKKTSSTRISHKGSFGHGTCKVTINNTFLSEKILTSLSVIRNQFYKEEKGM